MENIINTIVGYIWSDALVYLALGVGIYFTIMTRAVQIRYFKDMIKLLFDKQTSSGLARFRLSVWLYPDVSVSVTLLGSQRL